MNLMYVKLTFSHILPQSLMLYTHPHTGVHVHSYLQLNLYPTNSYSVKAENTAEESFNHN